ncbi:S-layer homology domain-containing protein [Gorillibacterium sp. sgz500922]|uniref:S-layer homology domain-containing protein n=1 Tax=Gorillibacterium sp. sgz500922 TaxID=3446694 RepID=UPI003F67C35A
MKNAVSRKILTGALALALTAGSFAGTAGRAAAASIAVPPTATNFTDVEKSYAKTEIMELVKLGILSGNGSGSFNPTAGSTRAEMAKVLTLALGLPENPQAAASFKDIPANAWYKGYVGALVKAGITTGTSATSFSPNEQVSREALAVFYVRAMGLEETAKKLAGKSEFADAAQISAWALPAVSLAAELGFIQGVKQADGKVYFQPSAKAERQALAKLTYSFYVNKEEYAQQAAKLEAAAASSTPTPSASTTPSPTPSPVVGGGGYVPPVSTPPPTGTATPAPTAAPTSTPTATPAPTMGQGDPNVASPYFANPYTANDEYLSGLVDGHSTVRIYYKTNLVGQCESDYAGNFSAAISNHPDQIVEGMLQVTSQRSGERESLPLNVKINPSLPRERSNLPSVDPIHSGDFIISGKARVNSYISIKDSNGSFIESGLATSNGSYIIPIGERREGEVLQITAQDMGKDSSEPVVVTVGLPNTEEKTYLGTYVQELSTGPILLSAQLTPGLTCMEITVNSSHYYVYQRTDGTFSYFNPDILIKPTDRVSLRVQSPGQAPSDEQPYSVTSTFEKTRKPVVGQAKYNALHVIADDYSYLFLRDDQGNLVFPVFERAMGARKLDVHLLPGKTYQLYAQSQYRETSDPVSISVAPVVDRAPKPTVLSAVYEGDVNFLIQSEPNTQLRVYSLSVDSEMEQSEAFTTTLNGTCLYSMIKPVAIGDKFLVIADQEGREASAASVITVQALPESASMSSEPIVYGTVYEGNYFINNFISMDGQPYSYVSITDEQGAVLGSGSGISYGSSYLDNPIPMGSKKVIATVQQVGRKRVSVEIPVTPVNGVTDSVSIIANQFVAAANNSFEYQGKPRDYIVVRINGAVSRIITILDSSYNQFNMNLTYENIGDRIDIIAVTPGKQAVVKSFVVQAP